MSQSDFVFHYSGWFWWVQQFLLCSPAVLECGVWNDVQPTVRHTWIHSTHQPLHTNQLQTSLQLLGTSVLLGRTTSLQFLQGLVSSRFLGNCFYSNGFSASCCHIKCSLMFEFFPRSFALFRKQQKFIDWRATFYPIKWLLSAYIYSLGRKSVSSKYYLKSTANTKGLFGVLLSWELIRFHQFASLLFCLTPKWVCLVSWPPNQDGDNTTNFAISHCCYEIKWSVYPPAEVIASNANEWIK